MSTPVMLVYGDANITPDLARTILPFLDGKSGSKTWAEQVKEQ